MFTNHAPEVIIPLRRPYGYNGCLEELKKITKLLSQDGVKFFNK
jgi:hypothetical protein